MSDPTFMEDYVYRVITIANLLVTAKYSESASLSKYCAHF